MMVSTMFLLLMFLVLRPISSVAKHTLSVQEVWDSITGPVKLGTVLPRLATAETFLRNCVA